MRRFVVFLVVLGLVFVAWSATAGAASKARPFKGYVIGTCSFARAPTVRPACGRPPMGSVMCLTWARA